MGWCSGWQPSKALQLHEQLLPIWNAISGDNLPANVKFTMELQGRIAGRPRSPMPVTTVDQAQAIQQAVGSLI